LATAGVGESARPGGTATKFRHDAKDAIFIAQEKNDERFST
jgi:hypothetical protein